MIEQDDSEDYVFYDDNEDTLNLEERCKGIEGTTCNSIDQCGDEGTFLKNLNVAPIWLLFHKPCF